MVEQLDILQGSDEWLNARLGIVTASNMYLVVTGKTLKPAANDKSRAYAYEIAAQRLTGHLEEMYQGWDMERGHIEEEIARDYYSEQIAPVTEMGFLKRTTGRITLGYSPDGLVGEDGLIEIKSRRQKFQIQTIANNEVPAEYMLQIQTGLMVSERKWCDFVQYSNGMPLFVKRVEPDHDIQGAILDAVTKFEDSVAAIMGAYNTNSEQLIQTERVDHNRDDEITSNMEI